MQWSDLLTEILSTGDPCLLPSELAYANFVLCAQRLCRVVMVMLHQSGSGNHRVWRRRAVSCLLPELARDIGNQMLNNAKSARERARSSSRMSVYVSVSVCRSRSYDILYRRHRSLLFVRASWSQLLQSPRLIDAKYVPWQFFRLTQILLRLGPRIGLSSSEL